MSPEWERTVWVSSVVQIKAWWEYSRLESRSVESWREKQARRIPVGRLQAQTPSRSGEALGLNNVFAGVSP